MESSHRGAKLNPEKFPFRKLHGAGNDFVMIDGRYVPPFDLEEFAQAACESHFGVGADGAIALTLSQVADYQMIYLNADGSRSICGNGIRCTARFIYDLGLLADGQRHLSIETESGVVRVDIIGKAEKIRVDMGVPTFEGERIPTRSPGEHLGVDLDVDGQTFQIFAAGMGNPHCVIFVEDLEDLAISEIGPKIEHHSFFPKRTNVEFVQIIDSETVRMRVWERGVGETLACGTGACAVSAVCARTGRTARALRMYLRGGEFEMHWEPSNDHMLMTGPTAEVFRGELNVLQLLDSWRARR